MSQNYRYWDIEVRRKGTKEMPYKERFYGSQTEAEGRCGQLWNKWDVDGRFVLKLYTHVPRKLLQTIG